MQDKIFTKRLLEWYDENPRSLPWKVDHDVYSVWLSEIIMQQTRVEVGKKYYKKFKSLFPKIEDLANAELGEVIKAWEGLGYYSRARNLHQTAQVVVNEFNGNFPTDYTEIQKLKGIGQYTGAAILSFTYNQALPAIDGNAYRVLSRVFGIETPIDKGTGKKEFFDLGEKLILQDPKRAGDFNQALMNFGAVVCKPKNASCSECVMQDICFAYQEEKVDDLPIKSKKIEYKNRFFTFFCIEFDGHFLVQERVGKDVWQNLYQFYLVESQRQVSWEKLIERSPLGLENPDSYKVVKISHEKQTLTHQKLSGVIVWVKLNKKPSFYDEHQWVNSTELSELPFPKMLKNARKMINLD